VTRITTIDGRVFLLKSDKPNTVKNVLRKRHKVAYSEVAKAELKLRICGTLLKDAAGKVLP